MGTNKELFRRLATDRGFTYSVVMDFDVPQALSTSRLVTEKSVRAPFDGEGVFVSVKMLSDLLRNPESVLEEVGLDPGEFSIQRYMAPNTKHVLIAPIEYHIRPFSIVEIARRPQPARQTVFTYGSRAAAPPLPTSRTERLSLV